MKKKVVSLLLASVMVVGVLAGCGSEKTNNNDSNKTGEKETQQEGKQESGEQESKKELT